MSFYYKIANKQQEFEKIHQLNYKTFVEEIPQHPENNEKKLVDPFHKENTYLICLDGDTLAGMLAVRDIQPFSLHKKVLDLESYLPPHRSVCEIRLLAVNPSYRNRKVFFGLVRLLYRYLKENYDLAVISGTTRELNLYTQMGFTPFYKVVGTENAQYQPMYLTPENFEKSPGGMLLAKDISFLPGPVEMVKSVKTALQTPPISHRSPNFQQKMNEITKQLTAMTRAKRTQIVLGNGTLANDMIAAQLARLKGMGVVLVNGEFGRRLQDQSLRAGLQFETIEVPYGEAFSYHTIHEVLKNKKYSWLWFVHCETSTGILNDLSVLKQLCKNTNTLLCADCISSLGAVSIDLTDVYFASGVSGKALSAYSGLAFVFYHHSIFPSPTLPRALDLGMYEKNDSIPYTHSSPLIEALSSALVYYNSTSPYEQIEKVYSYIRKEIESLGLRVIATPQHASPTILTIELDKKINSQEIGYQMGLQGYLLHYATHYLLDRNWIQIACIGALKMRDIKGMLSSLHFVIQEHRENTVRL